MPNTNPTDSFSILIGSGASVCYKKSKLEETLDCVDSFYNDYKSCYHSGHPKLKSVEEFCNAVKTRVKTLSEISNDDFDSELTNILVSEAKKHFTHGEYQMVARIIADILLIILAAATCGLALGLKYSCTGYYGLFSTTPTELEETAFFKISLQDRPS